MPYAPPKGTMPVLQFCTPAMLSIDRSYQRDLDAVSRQLIGLNATPSAMEQRAASWSHDARRLNA